ncbi:hypothetical protein ACHAW6_009657 [Cyclotella cf. meneghiniana]
MSTELRRRPRHIPSFTRGSIARRHPHGNSSNEEKFPRGFPDYFRFFRFDSLRFSSTARRNVRMLGCSTKNGHETEHETKNEGKDMIHCDASSAECISHFGSHVNFTPQFHYTKRELEPYRYVGDAEMDYLLEYLANTGEFTCGAFDDVIAYCANVCHLHTSRQDASFVTKHKLTQSWPPVQFYNHFATPPPWANFEQIQRGIDVILAYLPAAGCALYYRSLVGGFSISKIVEVLVATRYLVPGSMRRKDPRGETEGSCHAREEAKWQHEQVNAKEQICSDDRKRTLERLLDTGGFMACCFAPPTDADDTVPALSLQPGGKGWEAALRVRVLHAKVRRSLLQNATRATGGWDLDTNGIPINQEDMAATLLAFSVNVLLGIELVAGKPLNEEDQRDYLALWRYIGWLLGVDTPDWEGSSNPNKHEQRLPPIDPCGPRKHFLGKHEPQATMVDDPILHSYATLESMILHLLHPTKESRQLVSHLLSFNGKVEFRSEMCRLFLGDPLSDSLGIAQCSTVATKCLVYFFLMFLRCYTLLAMTFPSIRRMFIAWHGSFQRKFLTRWEADHAKRVGVAMGGGKKDGSDLKGTCPFSMLMPPFDVQSKKLS